MSQSRLAAQAVANGYNRRRAIVAPGETPPEPIGAAEVALILKVLAELVRTCDATNPRWPPKWLRWIPGIGTPGIDAAAIRRRAQAALNNPRRHDAQVDRARVYRAFASQAPTLDGTEATSATLEYLAGASDAEIVAAVEELR